MKKLLAVLRAIGVASSVRVAGPYEIGAITLENTTCQWTTYTKKSCYRADAQKKIAAFNTCSEPKLKALNDKCRDVPCLQKKISEIAKRCCSQTGGKVVK